MSAVSDYTWPDDLPPGCPPESAIPASGTFFRLVKGDPPVADDFVRPIDLPNGRSRCDPAACDSYSLSMLADPDDVKTAQALVPSLNKKRVARGDLTAEMGVVLRVPAEFNGTILKSHHDWWVPTTYAGLPPFELVPL